MSHAAANIAATTSNAEASHIKEHAPNLEVTTTAQPVQPVDAPVPAPTPAVAEPITASNDVSLEDAASTQAETEVKVNGHSSAPKDEDPPVADTSFTDSGLPDSIPSTLVSTDAMTDISPVIAPSSASLPNQAPVSDLRTAPHADALSAEEVAKVETMKHDLDNNAEMQDAVPSPQPEEPMSITEKESSLPTPQSPPTEEATVIEPSRDTVASAAPSVQPVPVPATSEKPEEPAPTPVPAVPTVSEPQDQEMVDAPAPKVVREREEDTADEPAPKRMRTEEPVMEEPSIKMAEDSTPAAQESAQESVSNAAPSGADDAVTQPRLAHMKKVISNLKKSTASQAFRTPVDPVALKIPTYFDIVKRPMDLGTIDNHLKRNDYQSVQAFKNDFYQIVANCVAFNGAEHQITQAAKKMETSFNNQMTHLPPATSAEPAKIVDKKIVKPKVEPIRQPPSRRQSETAKAASPKAPSPTTFAPNPNGMPLIRRDSTVDGRPKRAIVPTKRISDFGGARPKKKKYELELRFADEILKIISSPKHWQANQYFTHPVDPVALNIPTYFQIIKKPMDLGTVRQKLDNGMYEKAKDFEEDVRLIFKNCFKFNPEGDYVYSRGQELEKLFSQEWAKKQDWIAAREPDSEPASVGGDDEEDESEEEEAGAESDEDDQNDQLKQLQAQLDAIKNQMGQLSQRKKKPSPGVSSKKANKKKSKSEIPPKFPGLQKDAKTKKPAKKAKPERERYVTFAEKQYISNGIAMLPERPMSEALKIIQNSVPALANSDQGEIELDIEEVPNGALLKLLAFVKKYAGPPPDEPKDEYAAPSVSKSKKSKSMSKQDQEAQIAELKGTLHHYNEAGSPDAMQSIETGAEDSDDDSDQESEEE